MPPPKRGRRGVIKRLSILALYAIGNDMRSSAITGNCVLSHQLCSSDNIRSLSMTSMAEAIVPRSAAPAIQCPVNFDAFVWRLGSLSITARSIVAKSAQTRRSEPKVGTLPIPDRAGLDRTIRARRAGRCHGYDDDSCRGCQQFSKLGHFIYPHTDQRRHQNPITGSCHR